MSKDWDFHMAHKLLSIWQCQKVMAIFIDQAIGLICTNLCHLAYTVVYYVQGWPKGGCMIDHIFGTWLHIHMQHVQQYISCKCCQLALFSV